MVRCLQKRGFAALCSLWKYKIQDWFLGHYFITVFFKHYRSRTQAEQQNPRLSRRTESKQKLKVQHKEPKSNQLNYNHNPTSQRINHVTPFRYQQGNQSHSNHPLPTSWTVSLHGKCQRSPILHTPRNLRKPSTTPPTTKHAHDPKAHIEQRQRVRN